MLSFPLIVTAVFVAAGCLLALVLLVVFLPRGGEADLEAPDSDEAYRPLNGRNVHGFTRGQR